MARLPYLNTDDLAPEDRELLERNLNLYKVIAHSPDGARAFAAPALYVRHHSRLDPRLRELAIIQIGFERGVSYEYAHHIEIGRNAGLSDDDIRAIATESSGGTTHLSAIERAVLAAARELFEKPALSDAVFAELAKELDAERIVDLIISISTYCGVVRLLGALEVDLEPGYEHLLAEFPLP
jgi:alkylhydroperoxidase family enzyme